MKSLTPDEKKYVRCVMKKRLLTIPLLLLSILAFLAMSFNLLRYAQAAWLWHRTEATVTMAVGSYLNEGYLCEYLCEGEQKMYTGSFRQARILFVIPYRGESEVGETEQIAYQIEKPYRMTALKVLESNVINWLIFCVGCFLLYLKVDIHLRKTLPIRLT